MLALMATNRCSLISLNPKRSQKKMILEKKFLSKQTLKMLSEGLSKQTLKILLEVGDYFKTHSTMLSSLDLIGYQFQVAFLTLKARLRQTLVNSSLMKSQSSLTMFRIR